jgi:hypothetical protein
MLNRGENKMIQEMKTARLVIRRFKTANIYENKLWLKIQMINIYF